MTKISNRIRYTRQSIINNTFIQIPQFLFMAEFRKMSSHAKVLYSLMLERHRVSIKNNWFDENGEVIICYKRETMQEMLNLSDKPVGNVIKELKEHVLMDERKQGLNKPNRIYLLAPVFDNNENLSTDDDYDFESEHYEHSVLRAVDTPIPNTENLRTRTRNNSVYGNGKTPIQDTDLLRPNNNKLNNNKKRNNQTSYNQFGQTASACDGNAFSPVAAEAAETNTSTSYSQILEMYNTLCAANNLRPINSINGKRKNQVSARLDEYGINGFVLLFEKVGQSLFLCGGGDRGWKADFDWLITPANMQKVLEGKYENNQSNTPFPQQTLIIDSRQNRQEHNDPFLKKTSY